MNKTARIQAIFSPPRVLLESNIDNNGINQTIAIINNTSNGNVPELSIVWNLVCVHQI